jgi:flagellar L-ring protein precursor FlgH
MTANRTVSVALLLGLAAVLLIGAPRAALAQSGKNYDEQYAAFLAAARAKPATNSFWIANLTSDLAARHINDLVTIKVEEAVSASGSADSSIGKKSSATAAFPSPASTALAKFLPGSSDTKASGSGSTSRTTALTAMLTGRVTEVLPSGDLVVEGVREIDINGDRQVVVLTGIIRVVDIQPGNIAPSSRLGQLRIRCLSQGLMKDSLTPGWLIRVLNKIF